MSPLALNRRGRTYGATYGMTATYPESMAVQWKSAYFWRTYPKPMAVWLGVAEPMEKSAYFWRTYPKPMAI